MSRVEALAVVGWGTAVIAAAVLAWLCREITDAVRNGIGEIRA